MTPKETYPVKRVKVRIPGIPTAASISETIVETSESAAGTAIDEHEAAADPHAGYQRESEKGVASGYAGLDAAGVVTQQPPAHNILTKHNGFPGDVTKYLDGTGAFSVPAGGGGGGGGSTSPAITAKAYRNTALNVANATLVPIPLDAEAFDTDSFHDNVTNPTRFTVPAGKAGKYVVIGQVSYSPATTGERASAINKNGVQVAAVEYPPTSASNVRVPAVTVLDLVAGDYIELVAYQDSGAARAINTGEGHTYLALYQVGGGGVAAHDKYRDLVLGLAPTAYYRLDETTGVIAADASPNNRPMDILGGIALGGATLLKAATGKSADFDGVDDRARRAVISTAVNNFTLCAWCKADALAPDVVGVINRQYIVKNGIGAGDAGGDNGYGLLVVDEAETTGAAVTGRYYVAAIFDGATWLRTDYQVVVGQRLFVCLVRRAGVSELWVNGVKRTIATGNTAMAPVAPATYSSIGAATKADGTGNSFWNGVVDEVAFFDTALLPSRIEELWNVGNDLVN